MKNSWQKVLSFVLALVMVLGMVPVTAFADEVQQTNAAALSDSMDGLSIAYPYNTETVQQSGTPVSRFEALTFESARNEVESAQMILSPDFDVTSFELTVGSLKNEKGNVIPSWAFEVYIQHYVTVSGSGNAPYWSDTYQMYNPTFSKTGYDGTYPDALIPQDAAITAGENKISAGKNGGIWVNLNVQNAAPGTYTGTATLNVNGTDMNIPVSVHIYDVSLPDQVHTKSSVGIWWDMVENGEGYIDRNLADTYFDYLVSKRIMPFDAWSLTRWDEAFADYAANYLAVSTEISSYGLYYGKTAEGSLDVDVLRTTLTTLINKNIALAQSGSSVDLFAKAYFYFGLICDEPRDDAEYAAVNKITAQLDSLKAELAPMLDAYPSIQASFMNLKHLVTGPNPTDKTYADKGSIFNSFIDDDYGNTALTGDSYIYAPQYQWLNTEEQRALYENEEELWWYGCCHPISPYPAYHINTPLVSARVESWMRYDYGIDGFVYSSVNIWGEYTDNGIKSFDYWNGYVNNGTPGDQILVLPGSDYGVYGPIGTIRIENIREGNEDYEYLWMLENEYGISDISAYTANLYSGVIADTDASIHYNNRKALLSKLEELSIAANGATEIAPGNEGFVRGQEIKPSTNLTIELGNTEEVATLSFDYKVTSGTFNISLNPDWDNAFGYFAFDANGKADAYEGVSVEKLDDGYYHVTFQLSKLTKYNGNPSKNLSFLYVRGAWTDATGYIDNVQYVLAKDYVEVYRGREITPSTSLTLELGNTEELSSLSFDYKVLSGTFNISLNPDWDNAFGYFAFDANGNVDPYDGVTLETLDDGYIRVTFDLAALTKYSGNPGKALSFLYIRGSWTDATGYIDNIKYVVAEKPVEPENRGQEIISRTDLTIALTNTEEVTTLSFDYKLTGGTFNISLNPDWDNYFGYFAFDTNGNLDPYDGVTLQTLEDGYTRVTFDLAALTKYSGSPSKVLTFLYLRGAWSDATGYIDNVQLNAGEDPEQPTEPEIVTRGQEIAPSTDLTIELGNTEEISTLSFDYKVTSGTFNISLNPDWDNSFGYFAFDANGNVDPYDGVTVEDLEDGYKRVTFDLKALSKTNGAPSKVLSFLYIRGGWTDATGYIDNVTFTLQKENEPGSGRVMIAADVHVSADDTHTQEQLKKTLTYAKNNGVDLLIFNGDTVNVGNEADYAALDSVFTEVFGSPEQVTMKFIFNMGNHEFYPTSACAHEETDYALQFSLFAQFASKWSDFTAEQGSIYLTQVNGISYIVAAPSDDWTYEENGKTVYCAALGGYHDNDIALIDSLIAEATANNPGEPVYLLSHHPWGETYGGDSYGMPESKVVTAMRAVMEKYPHLVNVTSHTHFSSVHERSFAQDKWTTINTGMHTYGKYVDIETDVNGTALDYVNIDGRRYTSTDAEGKALHGTTHFVWDINYGGDSFTATIFNMATEATYSYVSYTVPYGITAENKSEKFAYELADRTAPTLTWSAEDVLTVELVKNGTANSLQLSFNDTDQFYATEGYRIKVVNAATGETLKTVLWASRFWAAQEKKDSYEIIVDGVTQCSEYKVTVEAIDFYGNYSAAKLEATVQSSDEEEVFRGQQIVSRTDLTIELGNAEELSTLSFDYKLTSGTFNISLNPDWDNYYGYFAFDANGNVDPYDGVTLETLEDGYTRVTFDLAALTKYSGNPSKVLTFLYLRGAWSDATGYIDNVQFTVAGQPEEPAYRGQEINPSTSLTIELGNTEELSTLSFDYKVLSGTFNISLNPDWDNAFGYFAFDANGNVDPYDGVTLETLEDGYTRVTFDLAALTKYNGNPGKALSFLYIRGAWTDATGYIDNIQYTVAEKPVEPENRGQEFSANTDLTIDLATTGVLGTLSFDYKITSGEAFNIALMPNWDSYYGYFAFTAEGSVDPYNGVTTEVLEDGYIRVTFDMDALTKVSGTPSKFIDFIYIRGGWTTANGYIDNIQWTEGCEHNYETITKEPTFTEVGGNVHTCSKCGNSYVTEEIPAYTFQVIQWNIALADDIRANFHLNVDSRLSDAKIIVMGKTYDLNALNKTEKGDYELSVNVAAAQMMDNISIQIVYGGVVSEELAYSIRQYAEKILTGTYSNTTKELIKAMLNYGAMAQTYFGYNTGNLANKDYVNTEAVEIPAVDTSNMVSGSVDGIRFYGASLVFESKVAVRFYFVVDGDINNYEFSTGTPVAKNGMYYIEVPGINPQDYATDIVLTVNDTLTVTYSPLTYISRKAGADNALADLVKAMYAYHLAAKAYLNGVETLGVSYSFTGNEADRAGYAEGTVTIANAEAGQTYEFYWADKNGKLSGYRALGSVTLAAEQTTTSLTVAENTMIPASADRLIVCITGSDEAAGTYLLGEKANTAELETKFAVISDVHTNYTQGEQYLLNALKRFEAESVSYVIITGDIGESDSDYATYVSSVEKSNFSGLVFASIGNHDQTETGRKNFKTYAIYDGSTKTWVGIDNAPAYFASTYAGSLNAAVELAGENLAYYVVTIGENVFIFMDQELTSTGNTPNQDNFSKEQLNFVEDKLYQYSATHNLFIIEHAPVEQLKIGDKFDPGYGGAIQLSAAYPNNQRFVDLLMEYTEAIWLSGHTHVQYDTGIMYVDKYYDASENLTDTAIAHAVHVSSLAQPRWYEGSSMKMPNDFSAASQGYVCYQYADDIVFEARSFKNYTPDSITYNANLFINEVNAVYSWAIPLETLTHDAPSYDEEDGGEEVTLIDYAVAENGYKRAGSPTWEDTDDGLKVTFAAASDRFEIKTGDQTEAFTNGYMVQFKIKTDLTSFDLGGSNYSGSRKTYIQVNLAASGDQYTVTDLGDGWKLVTIPMSNLGHDSIITEFAIRFFNTNAAGTFYLKELYIAPEMAEEAATDYAVAENGYKRAGSPTWEDTDDGLKVTFAEASDRFEIKTGDQTEAFTNGYTVQFKIKTDLTSFDLGGSNYSGSRKTYIQVNLAASGDQYTVTDLGDGWKLVTIPMTNLGHSSIITEFAIRFYNTNAAGTFYLKDLNIIPAK